MLLLAARSLRRRLLYTIMRAVFDSRFFELFGGLDGRPFVLESPRIVLVAT
jgi:hypothetical protein